MKKSIVYLLLLSTAVFFASCEDKEDNTGKKSTSEFDASVQQESRSESAAIELDNALNLAFRNSLRASTTDTFQVTPDWVNQEITVNFGTGYTGQDGLVRTGKVTIHYSTLTPSVGTVYTTTSSDYTVAGYKITGSITKTVTGYSTYITRATIVEDISVEYPDGIGTVKRQGTIDRGYTMEQGGNYTVSSTGEVTITELSGRKVDYKAEASNPLIYKTTYNETVKGILTAQIQGDSTIWSIDFGNGTQDGGAFTVYRN